MKKKVTRKGFLISRISVTVTENPFLKICTFHKVKYIRGCQISHLSHRMFSCIDHESLVLAAKMHILQKELPVAVNCIGQEMETYFSNIKVAYSETTYLSWQEMKQCT